MVMYMLVATLAWASLYILKKKSRLIRQTHIAHVLYSCWWKLEFWHAIFLKFPRIFANI